MGNCHLSLGHANGAAAAIKCYRMALDTLPPPTAPGGARARARLQRNIGVAFAALGQYGDAAAAFEAAADAAPDDQQQAAFNLAVCCYALGDADGMRGAFERLVAAAVARSEEGASDDEEEEEEGGDDAGGQPGNALVRELLLERAQAKR
jgi:intraflagellar transport protein 88